MPSQLCEKQLQHTVVTESIAQLLLLLLLRVVFFFLETDIAIRYLVVADSSQHSGKVYFTRSEQRFVWEFGNI